MSELTDRLLSPLLADSWGRILLFLTFPFHFVFVLILIGTDIIGNDHFLHSFRSHENFEHRWDKKVLRKFIIPKTLAVVLGVGALLVMQLAYVRRTNNCYSESGPPRARTLAASMGSSSSAWRSTVASCCLTAAGALAPACRATTRSITRSMAAWGVIWPAFRACPMSETLETLALCAAPEALPAACDLPAPEALASFSAKPAPLLLTSESPVLGLLGDPEGGLVTFIDGS